VNYYIDNYAAGGTWNINPAGGCSASSGSLVLAGADTAKLSHGTHTLKVDWLGNNAYGPSQSVMTFTMTSSPTPTLTPTPAPPPTPGLEALYALGALGAVFLVLRITRRR